MWEHEAKPRLRERSGSGILVTTTVRVIGLGEGAVEEQLGDLIHGTNPTVATYAKPDGVHVRISAKAADEAQARALMAPAVEQVEGVLKEWVYGRDDETLAKVAAQLLLGRGWTLASAERGTAGALAAEIASDDGLIARYQGGFVVGVDGLPLGESALDPSGLSAAAATRTGAQVAVATVLDTADGRPAAEFAVSVGNAIRTGNSRWNMGVPELRRRAAVETLALLVRTLRDEA
jgi:nicotinamide-nucleotide amidase